jgi:DNA-binding phage protein
MKTTTTPYGVAEHLRTPEEMAAYLEACIEEADGDAACIAKAEVVWFFWTGPIVNL